MGLALAILVAMMIPDTLAFSIPISVASRSMPLQLTPSAGALFPHAGRLASGLPMVSFHAPEFMIALNFN